MRSHPLTTPTHLSDLIDKSGLDDFNVFKFFFDRFLGNSGTQIPTPVILHQINRSINSIK